MEMWVSLIEREERDRGKRKRRDRMRKVIFMLVKNIMLIIS